MQIIPQFDPSAATNGVINVGAADAGSKLLLYNKSPYDLQLDFYNGMQSIAHAKQARYWTLDGDTKQVGWSIPSAQNVHLPAQSLVQGELYSASEKLEGVYPVSIDIQTDASNNLINSSQGDFDMKHNDYPSGQSGNVFLIPTATQTAYITGFTISAKPGAANLSLNLDISGVNTVVNPDFWITSTSTQGCFQSVQFAVAQPATAPGVQIGLRLLTNANALTSIVIYGYYVDASTVTSSGGSTPVSGVATNIQNDGNVAGSRLIEATVSGDSASAVTLTNSAVMVLGDVAHPGSLTVLGPVTLSGAVGITGVLTANGGVNANTLRDDTNGNTALDMSAGTGDVTMPHTLTIGTQLALPLGTLTKIAQFGPYTVGTVAAAFNHNLGVVPDLILLVESTNAGVHAVSYESTTMSTTQVTLLAGGASTIVRGLAIKF